MAVLDGRNRAKPNEAASYLATYENFDDEKASIMGKAMAECAKITERQKELLDDFKEKTGWSKKVIKDAAWIRKQHAKIRDRMGEQEEDTAQDLDGILKEIGGLADLPLGRFVVDNAPPKKKTAEEEASRNAALDEAIKKDEADKAAKKKSGKDAKPDDDNSTATIQ